MDDLISRQAAIDIERNSTVDTNPSHFEAHQKFTQFMDDAEISSFGRWQWSNGFNTALTAVGIDLKKLPSAQMERKRGGWIKMSDSDGIYFACSICGEDLPRVVQRFDPQFDLFPRLESIDKTNYCPNCGADMRGETGE